MPATRTSTEQPRSLTIADLPSALELSTSAGWNQTGEDWRMLMELAPNGCFGIEAEGRLVSTTTLVCYGKQLAWIGMVLTMPEYRGRGLARRLLAHALHEADALGVKTLKLDATEQGRPLYEKFGFAAEQGVERWYRTGANSNLFRNPTRLPQHSHAFDLETFGADRSRMLERLAERSAVYAHPRGFLFARAGRTSRYLGPCAALDQTIAHELITQAVSDSLDTAWSWDLLPNNRHTVSLATEFGFAAQRALTRMSRGTLLPGRDDMIYAIASFELG